MKSRAVAAVFAVLTIAACLFNASETAQAQAVGAKKPNILFIMGDDIGWMQVGV